MIGLALVFALLSPLASSQSTTTVAYNSALFQPIATDWVITSATTTRTYDFSIAYATGAPDGWEERQMLVINGQYPAPLIEANEGDTLVINVQNNLETGQGLHWHGILQNGTNWADGVPGINGCPIPPGGTFTYTYDLDNIYGTYWYHSHFGNTMADGLHGSIIVHSPNDPWVLGVDYDYDQIIYLGDWMHNTSDTITTGLLSAAGYLGSTAPPAPDALMINALRGYNCSGQTTECTVQDIPTINVIPNSTYRFRILNYASHAMFTFSIDDHPLTVIAADGYPIVPVEGLHQLPVNIAQRYDILVTTNQTGDSFYIRAAVCTAILGGLPSTYETLALAALQYVPEGGTAPTGLPNSSDWSDSVYDQSTCSDLANTDLVPSTTDVFVQTEVLGSVILNSEAGRLTEDGQSLARFFWNSVTWTNYIYQPLLYQVQAGDSINASLITTGTFSGIGGADIIINNLDAGIDHPYHLHGNPFAIVARGSGALTAATYAALDIDITNAPTRDTITIPRSTYAVLRITSDNPGVWPLHCHIGWHLAQGKMAAIIVQPDALVDQTTPSAATALCSEFTSGDTVDSIYPGKREAKRAAIFESSRNA